jgi:hypothetical protein
MRRLESFAALAVLLLVAVMVVALVLAIAAETMPPNPFSG